MTRITIHTALVRATFAIAAMAATCTLAAPVLAKTTDDSVRQMKIAFTDLDLSTDTGRAQLDARIQRAAKAVCSGDESSKNLADFQRVRRCRAQAEAQAFASLATFKPEQLAAK